MSEEEIKCEVVKATGSKCLRCWKVLQEVGLYSNPDVCFRCLEVLDTVTELDELINDKIVWPQPPHGFDLQFDKLAKQGNIRSINGFLFYTQRKYD